MSKLVSRVPRLIPLSLCGLLAIAVAGCGGVVHPDPTCDCAPGGMLQVQSVGASLSQLSISGAACGDPYCPVHDDAGGCSLFSLSLFSTGSCLLTGTALDGRQESAAVTVRIVGSGGCCGPRYAADGDVTFTFPTTTTPPPGGDGGL